MLTFERLLFFYLYSVDYLLKSMTLQGNVKNDVVQRILFTKVTILIGITLTQKKRMKFLHIKKGKSLMMETSNCCTDNDKYFCSLWRTSPSNPRARCYAMEIQNFCKKIRTSLTGVLMFNVLKSGTHIDQGKKLKRVANMRSWTVGWRFQWQYGKSFTITKKYVCMVQ